jgi:hypothetical protein
VRFGYECPGDLEPPPLPAAVAADRPGEDVRETERIGHVGDPAAGDERRDTPQARVQFEVAKAAQRPVDDGLLEHDAAHGPGRERVGYDVMPGQPSSTVGRRDSRGEHADSGGLPRAVRPEQTEDFTRADREVDAAHGLDAAGIGLGQADRLDSGDVPVRVTAQVCRHERLLLGRHLGPFDGGFAGHYLGRIPPTERDSASAGTCGGVTFGSCRPSYR